MFPVFWSRNIETIWFPEEKETRKIKSDNHEEISSAAAGITSKSQMIQLDSNRVDVFLCVTNTYAQLMFTAPDTHYITWCVYTLRIEECFMESQIFFDIHRHRLLVSTTTLQATQITHSWTHIGISSHMRKRAVTLSRNIQLFSIPCPPWTDGNIDSRSRGNKRGNRAVRGDDGGWWLSVSDHSPVRLSSCRDIWPHSWFLTQIELMSSGEFRRPYSLPLSRLSTHSVGYLTSTRLIPNL